TPPSKVLRNCSVSLLSCRDSIRGLHDRASTGGGTTTAGHTAERRQVPPHPTAAPPAAELAPNGPWKSRPHFGERLLLELRTPLADLGALPRHADLPHPQGMQLRPMPPGLIHRPTQSLKPSQRTVNADNNPATPHGNLRPRSQHHLSAVDAAG